MRARSNPVTGAAPFTVGMARYVEQLARRLIRAAARGAPDSLAPRLQEEWLADLAARPTATARLRLALGCCWATRVIAHEFSAPRVPAASAATGANVLNAYAHPHAGFFSRRTIALLVIASVHLLVIYALAAGLLHPVSAPAPPATLVDFTPVPHIVKPPPPPSGPRLQRTLIDKIPAPQIPLSDPDDSTAPRVSDDPLPPAPAPTPALVRRVQGGAGAGFPSTEDYYPAAAIRLREQGMTTVRVCVDAAGRLTAAPLLVQSSGSPRLDDSAQRLARDGSGRYRPTTEDGRPVSACFALGIRFRMRE
jgi:TonB family protein